VVACARRPASAEDWARHTGGQALPDAAAVAAAADVLVLAMKPPQAPAVMATLQPLLQPRHVVVSVAAGVRLTTLAAGLGPGVRLLRAMPNTPCLVGAGATGVAAGPQATAEDRALALRLFGAVGVAEEVPEALLDAVTGVSGSGPAYFFLAIEGLADGGVRAGLPRATALRLAAQAALGAARLVLETGQHPGALKDQVASPGGTTIAALASLERAAVRSAFLEAAVAAADRAREMGTS
jgi:pyrroline-5-carboxylate reductase